MKQKVPYSTLFPRVPYHISSICVGLFRPQPNIWPTIRLSLISNGSDRFANKSLPLIFSIRWSKCERSTASDHPSLSTDVEGLTLSHLHATPRTCKHLCACVPSLNSTVPTLLLNFLFFSCHLTAFDCYSYAFEPNSEKKREDKN